MKAIIAHRSGEPRLVELGSPRIGPGNVLIRVTHLAMNLSEEFLKLRGMSDELEEDIDGYPIGSLASGLIEEVGANVTGLRTGLRVAAYGIPYVYHAQYLSVPARLCQELPKRVNHEEGAFAGLGARALHLIRRSQCQIGETLIVMGAGMLGNLVAQVAKAMGVKVILTDTDEGRLSKARTVGLSDSLAYQREKLIELTRSTTKGAGADTIIYTMEAPEDSLKLGPMILKNEGRIVLGSYFPGKFEASTLFDGNLQLIAENRAGYGEGDKGYESGRSAIQESGIRWPLHENMQLFLEMLSDRRVQISPLVSERTPLERAPSIYEKIKRNGYSTVASVLTC